MAITDLITIALSFFLIIRGFLRGFLNSLLGPFSIIAATIISIIYYQQTKQLNISLIIGLVGPLLLHIILNLIIGSLTSVKTPTFPSRAAGGVLTLIWGWIFIIFTLILLATLPPLGNKIPVLQHDILHSNSYAIASSFRNKFFPSPVTSSPQETLAQDADFQKLMSDPQIQDDINSHNIGKLMQNPKIMAFTKHLMADPEELKKFLSLYSQMSPHAQTSAQPAASSN